MLPLGSLKNAVVLDKTLYKFLTNLLTFRWNVPLSNFIPRSTARMQSARFSEWWLTFYHSTRYPILIPGATQMSVVFCQSDSDVLPKWPSWMQDLCPCGTLWTCVQLIWLATFIYGTVERHILLAGRQVLTRLQVCFHEDVVSAVWSYDSDLMFGI